MLLIFKSYRLTILLLQNPPWLLFLFTTLFSSKFVDQSWFQSRALAIASSLTFPCVTSPLESGKKETHYYYTVPINIFPQAWLSTTESQLYRCLCVCLYSKATAQEFCCYKI